jgi:cyclase
MIIYPAIDLLDGKVVRLKKGDYNDVTEYSSDPVEVARGMQAQGSEWIHIIDLNGAKQGASVNKDTIEKICKAVACKVQIGGGIRSMDNARAMLGLGVSRVIIGTTALKHLEVLKAMINEFGSDSIVVSIDIKNGQPASEGWLEFSELSSQKVADNLRSAGVKTVIVTDISKDGMLEGPNVELTRQWKDFGFETIAAGGVTTEANVTELKSAGVDGAIIGKALYEKTITIAGALFAAMDSQSSLALRIIPCMDIKDGRVVKGTGFLNFVDDGDPLELAKLYSAQNADELVLLDIAATTEARKNRVELVGAIAKEINIPFTIGGGISEIDDIRQLLLAGADKVSIGTAAITNPDIVDKAVAEFGAQAIVISLDLKREGGSWNVFTYRDMKSTGLNGIEFAKDMERRGAGELLVNSMDRDGTKKGYDIELLSTVTEAVSIPVIASSGVGSIEDFYEVFEKTGVTAALAASVFHNGSLSIEEVKNDLKRKGLKVRL